MKITKPMLAHKYDESRVDWSQPVYMQPKLDGVRCLIQYEVFPISQGGARIVAYSRTGKEFMNIEHIKKDLELFFEQQPDVILDGELYNHDLRDDFEKIISLVRKQKPTDEDKSNARKLIQFHCYDYIETVMNQPYSYRMNQLVCSNIYSYCIKYVPAKKALCEKGSKVIHGANLHKGYEGSIMRLDGKYKHGRSYDLMKFKDFSDTEATIVDWVEGKGKRVGTIGKFIAIDSEGIRFGMPVMDKFKYLQENFEEMQGWVGKTATFTYFERTKANSYRHPLFKALRNYE